MDTENRVTKLEELDRSRVKVYINQEFAFVLYKGELRLLHIKEGDIIANQTLKEIQEDILPRRAIKRSMNLLKSREYTEKQLRDKLTQGLYSKSEIDQAIEYVKAYHYIDDDRYAQSYITYYSEMRSRGRIEMDLLRKGISKEMIRAAYDVVAEKENLTKEEELIEKELSKKRFDKENASFEEKQKMMAALYRKGFQMDKIRKVLD